MKKRLLTASIVLVGMLIMFPSLHCAKPSPPGVEPIKVGSLLDASGFITAGIEAIDATHMAIDTINAEGGVLGRPLELVEYDTQSNNDLYTQYATQLILDDKVAVIVGGVTSASREAVRSVTDRYNMPYIYNILYEGGVADKLVFCTGIVPEQQIKPMVAWAIEEFGPKVYIVAADYNYGWISADWGKFYIGQYGGQTVGEEFIPLEISEFSTTLAKIQGAKPDWIMSYLVGANHFAFYRQWAAMGLKEEMPIVSGAYAASKEHVALTPDEGEGIYVVEAYFQELDNPANKEFVTKWHERYGEDYPYITAFVQNTWVAWQLWARAVNQAGSLETDKVIAELESGLEFDAPEGKIRLDPATHHMSHQVYLGRGNRNHGFDIIKEFGRIEPTWHQETFDLIENPDLNKLFTPEL